MGPGQKLWSYPWLFFLSHCIQSVSKSFWWPIRMCMICAVTSKPSSPPTLLHTQLAPDSWVSWMFLKTQSTLRTLHRLCPLPGKLFLQISVFFPSKWTFIHVSHVWLFATPWTVARQSPLPMGFSQQEYWSGLSFPSPGDLSDPGVEPMSLAAPALVGRFFTTWDSTFLSGLCLNVTSSEKPGDSDGKESACNARYLGLIPGLGRSPREGNGNLLQYSWLENLWTEEPGGLQFMGSQRVGHNQATNTFTFRKASPFLIPLDCSSIGNIYHIKYPLKLCVAGFPGSSIVKNPTCQCRRHEFDLCSRRSRMPRRA